MYDEAVASTCLARDTCRQHKKSCSRLCAVYIDTKYQTGLSGIPLGYEGQTVSALPPTAEHLDDLRHFIDVTKERRPKNGLYLWSATCGNGKTMTACALAQSYIGVRTIQASRSGESLGQLVMFVNTTELLDLIRAGFDDDVAAAQASELVRRINRAELVVIDDLGAERPSAWVAERFYAIINGLWARRALLVVTSNKSLDGIEMSFTQGGEATGARIRSRVEGLTISYEFRGADYRSKRK